MAPTFLGIISPFRPKLTRSGSSSSITSGATGETSSQARLSNSSTPPTSAADSESISSSTAAKLEVANDPETPHGLDSDSEIDAAAQQGSTGGERSRRSRASAIGIYNIKALGGRAIHAPRKFKNADGEEIETITRRRTVSGDTLVSALGSANASSETVVKEAKKLVCDGIEALDLEWSVQKLPKSQSQIGLATRESPRRNKKAGNRGNTSLRRATRSAGEPVENLTRKLSVLGKRGRDKFEAGLVKAKRELRRLADTNEFAKVETKPVVAEVWSNGKLVTGDEPPKKKIKVEVTVKFEERRVLDKVKPKKKGTKIWLDKGLYAGQQARNLDWFAAYSKEEKKKLTNMPDFKPNGNLPLPMWHGQRLLHAGRNFKLPFDVCSPLPPGQPKPDEWRKVPKNRFVGDAAAAWKKSTVFDDFSSRCVCSKLNGCDESCQNRIMLYECDQGNCSAGPEHCTNRAFADLQARRSKGGKYRIGVEVIKTADRGYGVRSNRCFDPNQIIVEYTGEIITEDECDRRMNEVYKNNECYYLMLFDQNMIIDATRGSIARFVNHSCEPNCRMVKWIVAGKPRMALFAGDRPIMTGEELTYDYNFDPFSAKNVQECRCGAGTCRGVLGPRPKDKPKATTTLRESIKQVVRAGKRKVEEILKGEKDIDINPKRRKIAIPIKRSTSTKAINVAKGLKRNLSSALASTSRGRKSVAIKNELATPKNTRKSQVRSNLSNRGKKQTYLSSSRTSSLTLTNEGPGKKGKGKGKRKEVKVESDSESSPAKAVKQVKERKLSAKGKELFRSKSTKKAINKGE